MGRTGPTPKQARGPRWRRTSHGFYVPADIGPASPEQRIVEAAAVLPSFGGVTGWAALRWHGGFWFTGTTGAGLPRSVHLATGGNDVRDQPGIRVSHEGLNIKELLEVDGVSVTTPIRSLFYELRHASSLWSAVEALDMACYSDLVSLDELATYLTRQTGWTGVDRARQACRLGHENSWSPRETWLRLVWTLVAGLDPPICNAPIFDRDGHHVGTPDLFEPSVGLLAEYDGGLHLLGGQRGRDVRRIDVFRSLGLECVTVVAGDTDVGAAERVLRARQRAVSQLAVGRRQWTLDLPSWWVRTDTVDRRRALGDADRTRWLGRRRRVS